MPTTPRYFLYSENGKTSGGAAKLLKTIMKDETFHDYLTHHGTYEVGIQFESITPVGWIV